MANQGRDFFQPLCPRHYEVMVIHPLAPDQPTGVEAGGTAEIQKFTIASALWTDARSITRRAMAISLSLGTMITGLPRELEPTMGHPATRRRLLDRPPK